MNYAHKNIQLENFNPLQETREILADQKLLKDIKEAEEDYKNGKYKTFKELFGTTPGKCLRKN
ncbi:MAG: hypothetical protein ABIJ43_00355 [Candidatus Beckwithbacteria bacterium]